MPIRFFILGLSAVALLAIPLSTYLPEPFSLITLLILTVLFPFAVVWLLQVETRRDQH